LLTKDGDQYLKTLRIVFITNDFQVKVLKDIDTENVTSSNGSGVNLLNELFERKKQHKKVFYKFDMNENLEVGLAMYDENDEINHLYLIKLQNSQNSGVFWEVDHLESSREHKHAARVSPEEPAASNSLTERLLISRNEIEGGEKGCKSLHLEAFSLTKSKIVVHNKFKIFYANIEAREREHLTKIKLT